MPGVKQYSRVDIFEIQIQIVKKLGEQKAEKYFSLLNNYFTLKIAKSEFNKLCIAIIGKENIRIHNILIQSILKNVCIAKIPPPPRRKYKVEKSNVIDEKVVKPTILEQRSAAELVSLGGKPPPVEVVSVEDGEEVDQGVVSPRVQSRGLITPPLGIPWNGKGCRKRKIGFLFSCSDRVDTCVGKGELPDTSNLRERMEVKLRKEGLDVPLECVNLVNSSLDVYIKRLVKSSLELSCSRVGNYLVNGLVDSVPGCGSMVDFRTAMELNPQMLGDDWPLLLEKVSLRDFENWD